MNQELHAGIAALSAARLRYADQVCDEFESAWKAGQRPRIEDYLGSAAEPERGALLRELVALDADLELGAHRPHAFLKITSQVIRNAGVEVHLDLAPAPADSLRV